MSELEQDIKQYPMPKSVKQRSEIMAGGQKGHLLREQHEQALLEKAKLQSVPIESGSASIVDK